MKPRYAGIGSREIDIETAKYMSEVASRLERVGLVLRSGKAKGSDTAFENGVVAPENKEIYTANDCQPWAIEIIKNYLPEDRSGFDNWKPYVKNLLGRNAMQILGKNGNTPVRFCVCWTPVLYYHNSDCGGTGYAIRLCLDKHIPVYNLKDPILMKKFEEVLEYLEND